jgi:TonB family protein
VQGRWAQEDLDGGQPAQRSANSHFTLLSSTRKRSAIARVYRGKGDDTPEDLTMLHELLESGVRRDQPRAGWTMASVLAHATLVSIAVALTAGGSGSPAIERISLESLVYTAPRPVAPTPPAPSTRGVASHPSRDLVIPTLQLPAVPLTNWAPASQTQQLVDPSAFGPGISGTIGDPAGVSRTGIHTASSVDRIVVPRADNPTPEYPASLRAASIVGEVLVQFVVDTTGRVDPATITVARTTHAQFGDAVRRWLVRTRYTPAEANGRRVPQLVQQEIGFSLRP